MRKILAVVLLGTASLAQATVLTFEGLPHNNPISNGYGGFNWNSATGVFAIFKSDLPGSGYDHGTIGNVSVFNNSGFSPTHIDWAGGGTFTFNGAQFTSAWLPQDIQFFGYAGANLVHTSSVYALSTSVPLWIELDWSGIDRLQITNTNYQWDMDNFTFNAQTVPEPATLALVGAALASLRLLRRKSTTA